MERLGNHISGMIQRRQGFQGTGGYRPAHLVFKGMALNIVNHRQPCLFRQDLRHPHQFRCFRCVMMHMYIDIVPVIRPFSQQLLIIRRLQQHRRIRDDRDFFLRHRLQKLPGTFLPHRNIIQMLQIFPVHFPLRIRDLFHTQAGRITGADGFPIQKLQEKSRINLFDNIRVPDLVTSGKSHIKIIPRIAQRFVAVRRRRQIIIPGKKPFKPFPPCEQVRFACQFYQIFHRIFRDRLQLLSGFFDNPVGILNRRIPVINHLRCMPG